MKQVSDHIFYTNGNVENPHEGGTYKKGHYFVDEAEILYGPYSSGDEAKDALTEYVKTLEKPKETVSQSEISEWMRCQYKWYLNYILRYSTKERQRALEVGDVYHEGQDLIGQKKDWDEIGEAVKAKFAQHLANLKVSRTQSIMDEYDHDFQMVVGILAGYIEHYKDVDNWEIIDNEVEFSVPIDVYGDGSVIVYAVGKKDKKVLDLADNIVKVIEHKTSSSAHFSVKNLPLNIQLLMYFWAEWKEHGANRAKIITYDAAVKPKIRQKKNETRKEFFERVKALYIEDPKKYFVREELKFPIKRLQNFDKRLIKYIKHMRRAKENPRDEIEKNTNACDDFGGCPYLAICRKESLKGVHMNSYFKRKLKHPELSDQTNNH